MPRPCCCASFCSTCVLCRRRKRFEDNILLVANDHSVDSLEVDQKKPRFKNVDTPSYDSDGCSDIEDECEFCSEQCKNCKKCNKRSDEEERELLDTKKPFTDSETSFEEDVYEIRKSAKELKTKKKKKKADLDSSLDDVKSSSTSISIDNSSKTSTTNSSRGSGGGNKRVKQSPTKHLGEDVLTSYLAKKLQRHVEKQFGDIEKEMEGGDDLRSLKCQQSLSRHSSLHGINSAPSSAGSSGSNHKVGREDSVSMNRVHLQQGRHETGFLNKFRATLMVHGRELKEKGNKLKKFIIKETSKDQNNLVNKEVQKEIKDGDGDKAFLHQKYHTKLDAET